MEQVSPVIQLLFLATTIACIFLFLKAVRYNRSVLFAILFIALLQSTMALTGFYLEFDARPPRFLILIFPSLLLVQMFFLSKGGKQIVNGLDIKQLTIVHTVRIPVEICLHALYTAQLIPQLMTYEGWNFDILSGITAPLIFYFVFIKPVLSKPFYFTGIYFA
jgi:hypothetical protein